MIAWVLDISLSSGRSNVCVFVAETVGLVFLAFWQVGTRPTSRNVVFASEGIFTCSPTWGPPTTRKVHIMSSSSMLNYGLVGVYLRGHCKGLLLLTMLQESRTITRKVLKIVVVEKGHFQKGCSRGGWRTRSFKGPQLFSLFLKLHQQYPTISPHLNQGTLYANINNKYCLQLPCSTWKYRHVWSWINCFTVSFSFFLTQFFSFFPPISYIYFIILQNVSQSSNSKETRQEEYSRRRWTP